MKTLEKHNTTKQKITSNTGVTARFEQMTEDRCKELIASVPDIQRLMKHNNYYKLVRDIKAGKWVENGQTIVISDLGNLINGQHRVRAFLACGFFPQVLVVKGVNEELGYKTTDTGTSRTAGDVFKAHGIPNYTHAGTISSKLIRILNKETSTGQKAPSFQELLECYFEREADIQYWMHTYTPLNTIIPKTVRGAINAYLDPIIGADVIHEFWKQVESGIGSNAARLLRKTLSVNANKVRGKFTPEQITQLVLLSVKRHINGDKTGKLILSTKQAYFH